MKLQLLDAVVILLYLIIVSAIGVFLQRYARRSRQDYMLGGNTIPWWMLGVSNASGMFDISGTIWMVAIMFIYGVKSIWLPWLWPVFNQIFLMVYLSIWLRRSNVLTGAEWILFRFGKHRDAELSHKVVIAFALLSCFGFMAYGFIGLGKFLEIFIPWSYLAPYIPFDVPEGYVAHVYGIVFTLFAVFYTILGGMTSIVWADLVQYVLMTIASISIAIIAMIKLSNNSLQVPPGWDNLFFGWNLGIDWSGYVEGVNQKIREDGFDPFGVFFSLMLAKGVLASLAGPAPNYDMQKILSTRTPRDAALMSMIVNIVLLPTRYFMIIGFAVLAILFYKELNIQTAEGTLDFERILPAAINTFVPPGLLGLLLVGLISAFMGTFSGTLNAAQAYLVNDIYLKSIRPQASNRQISAMNYIVGIVVVFISILLGLFAKDVNSVLQWITSALYGGYVASNVLKWHWWRFNGYGFFWGMIVGIISAMALPYIFIETVPLYYFPLILLFSTIGAIAGSLLTPPTDESVLINFYKKVRPWGYWEPIYKKVLAEDPAFEKNTRMGADLFNVLIGTIAQTAITVLPVYIVLLKPLPIGVSALILLVSALILKINWFDKLPKN